MSDKMKSKHFHFAPEDIDKIQRIFPLRGELQNFVRACVKWANDNPEEARALLEKYANDIVADIEKYQTVDVK